MPADRPDYATPWTVAVFCDEPEHDPAKRPRILTAEHPGGDYGTWWVSLHGGHWQTIRDGKRIDKRRHWPAPEPLTWRHPDGGYRRVVLKCRGCGWSRTVAYADEHLGIVLDRLREYRRKRARSSDFLLGLRQARADLLDRA